ncbi:MAG: pilin [Patescibacteria group bacterium]|nr:pilin [Patescibacteria group bacterium]
MRIDQVFAASQFDPGSLTNPTKYGDNISGLGKLINNGFFAVVTIAGLAFLAYLIMGGIKYLTSGGDSKAAQSARETITNALIGLVIVTSVWFIALIIQTILGINILDPEFIGP